MFGKVLQSQSMIHCVTDKCAPKKASVAPKILDNFPFWLRMLEQIPSSRVISLRNLSRGRCLRVPSEPQGT